MKKLKRGRGFSKKVFLKTLNKVRQNPEAYESEKWLNDQRTKTYMRINRIK